MSKPFAGLFGLGLVGATVVLAACLPVSGLPIQNPKSKIRNPVAPCPPPPAKLVERLNLSPFYRKWVDAKGLPIVGSERVSDVALREAAYLINHMLAGRDVLRKAMIAGKVRVAVMAATERTTDIPEHSDLTPAAYWNRRARGLGATPERPASSCAEENLLHFPGDPYNGENILVHEFAHTMHLMGLRKLGKAFDTQLNAAYAQAHAAKLWDGFYADTDAGEYWAEGVQSWFDCNHNRGPNGRIIATREQLQAYDPALFRLIDSVFRDKKWRYVAPAARTNPAERRDDAPNPPPQFQWDKTWQSENKQP